jgi:hypothetical protein
MEIKNYGIGCKIAKNGIQKQLEFSMFILGSSVLDGLIAFPNFNIILKMVYFSCFIS